jgi:glucose/arabinose dehydrogenase
VIRLGAGGRPAAETRVQVGARVRDVSVGPDGAVYVLTDEEAGRIVRLTAAK